MTDREIRNKLKTFPLSTVQSICCSGNEFWSNAAQSELKRRDKKLKLLAVKKQKEKERCH